MHSNVTIKNVSWPHYSWATLYILSENDRASFRNDRADLFENKLQKQPPVLVFKNPRYSTMDYKKRQCHNDVINFIYLLYFIFIFFKFYLQILDFGSMMRIPCTLT